MKVGDVILKIDDTVVESNSDIIEYINLESVINKGKVMLTVSRNSRIHVIEAIPKYSKSTNKYELGMWVKDSSAGVGKVSFYELNNRYFTSLRSWNN